MDERVKLNIQLGHSQYICHSVWTQAQTAAQIKRRCDWLFPACCHLTNTTYLSAATAVTDTHTHTRLKQSRSAWLQGSIKVWRKPKQSWNDLEKDFLIKKTTANIKIKSHKQILQFDSSSPQTGKHVFSHSGLTAEKLLQMKWWNYVCNPASCCPCDILMLCRKGRTAVSTVVYFYTVSHLEDDVPMLCCNGQ